MSESQIASWYWPPAFNDARQLVEYYETVNIPDEAMFRFARAYHRRAVNQGTTGIDSHIPPHVMQTVLRATMMRALGRYFPVTEQQKIATHQLTYLDGSKRTVKWIALHFQTDDLGFDALYGDD